MAPTHLCESSVSCVYVLASCVWQPTVVEEGSRHEKLGKWV